MLPFRRSMPMLLNAALDAIMPPYRTLFAEFDLTEQQWRILRTLWNHDTLSSSALAEHTLLPPPSLVGILDRLEKKDLITRTRSDTDRRVVYVSLTDRARALEAQILPKVTEMQGHLRRQFTEKEWAEFETYLTRLADLNKGSSLSDVLHPAQTEEDVPA